LWRDPGVQAGLRVEASIGALKKHIGILGISTAQGLVLVSTKPPRGSVYLKKTRRLDHDALARGRHFVPRARSEPRGSFAARADDFHAPRHFPQPRGQDG
jgi:hypothetical protein